MGSGKSITANSLYCPTKEGMDDGVDYPANGDKNLKRGIMDGSIIDGSRQMVRKSSTFANSDNCSTKISIRKQCNKKCQVGKDSDITNNQGKQDFDYNELCETAVNDTIEKLSLLFPEQVTADQINRLREVAIEGYKLADSIYTAKDAEEWGDHYKVSDDLVNLYNRQISSKSPSGRKLS